MKTKTALKAGWKQTSNCGCDKHHQSNGGGLAIVVGVAVVIGLF